MALPYHNLRSKLNRAIRQWLISQGCGQSDDIHCGFTVATREFPNTTVKAAIGSPETPFSGNYRVRVMITVKGHAEKSKSNAATDPELARVLFDERLAKTFDALMQTDDNQTLQFTAKSITSAGRGLVPTSLVLNSAGTNVNGRYNQASALQWNREGGEYSIVYIAGDGQWHIYNQGAVVMYSCPQADFPAGPWTVGSGSAPVPQFKRADNWDMGDFTLLAWYEAGFGEPEADGDGCDWAETILFDAVCCPSNVGGYSLTD